MAITTSQKQLLQVISENLDDRGIVFWATLASKLDGASTNDMWSLRDHGLVAHGPEKGRIQLTTLGRQRLGL